MLGVGLLLLRRFGNDLLRGGPEGVLRDQVVMRGSEMEGVRR